MTPDEQALAAAIRQCIRCRITAPGQSADLLCAKHRRALDAIADPCDDPTCTACPPAEPVDVALPRCDNPGAGHLQHVTAVDPGCLL